MEMTVQYRVQGRIKSTDVLRTFEGIAGSSIQCNIKTGATFTVHEGNRWPRLLLWGHLCQNGQNKKNMLSLLSIRVQQNTANCSRKKNLL